MNLKNERRMLLSILMVGGLLVWSVFAANGVMAANALEEVAQSIVQVRVFSEDDKITDVTGFALDRDGHVLTSQHATRRGDRFVIVTSTGATEISAQRVFQDPELDIAVLKAIGLDSKPVKFSAPELVQGRIAFSYSYSGSGQGLKRHEGAIGGISPLEVQNFPSAFAYTHNAMIDAAGFGSPLVDECGRVVGVNTQDLADKVFFSNRAQAPKGFVYAVAIGSVIDALKSRGLSIDVEEALCRPVAQVAREKVGAAERNAETAKREAAAAKAEAQSRKQEAELAKKKAEKAVKEAKLGKKALDKLKAKAQEKDRLFQEIKAEAERLAQIAQQVALETKRKTEELKTQVDESEKRVLIFSSVAGAVVVLIIIVAVSRTKRSQNRAKLAKAQVGEVEKIAADAEARAQAAEQGPDRNARPGWGLALQSIDFDRYSPEEHPQSYASDEFILSRKDGIQVGRYEDHSNIKIDHETVSRTHARIYLNEGTLFIEDLKSANGTKLGSRRLEPYEAQELIHGDLITLGGVVVVVVRVSKS